MNQHNIRGWWPVLLLILSAHVASAGVKLTLEPADPPSQPPEIQLDLDDNAGSQTNREQWVKFGNELWLHNVTKPSMWKITPSPHKANGSSVLVLPGGGFKFLAMNNEGWPIAEKLSAEGMTVFVLKYRLIPSPADPEAFAEDLIEHFAKPLHRISDKVYELPRVRVAKTDAQVALRYIHDNAEQLGVDPERVGILGFSAGAIAAMAVALDSKAAARPAFIGSIYGSLRSVTPPENPQPLFFAAASDDAVVNNGQFDLIRDWHDAGGSTELHWYAGGGHGFAFKRQGTTSDFWLRQFVTWLKAQQVL